MKKSNELEVGDKVIVRSRYNSVIDEVERLTKTQVVIKKSNTKYSRKNGHSIGGYTFDSSHIIHASKEQIFEITKGVKKQNLVSKIENQKWKDLPIEVLEEIKTILSKQEEK